MQDDDSTNPDPDTQEPEQHLNACPSCQSLIDVTRQEPWTRVRCIGCGHEMRVRTGFHHFIITEQIGTGGMSRVFRAGDQSLERDVALKILNQSCSRDEIRMRQFEKEAEITARISHPHVVKVYTASRDQGYFYIAMELVGGGSLDDLILKGPVPEARALDIAIACVEGLKAASSSGLIHRDIKPGNILFSADGTPKIVDFGLAVFARDSGQGGEIWATPFYVPPETLHALREDFRSDIYALGATLYHALMGKPPFDKDTNSIEELKLIKARPVDLKEASSRLSVETVAMLERCLQRKPLDRYRSYDEFLDHLRFARRQLQRKGKGGIWPGRKKPGLTPAQRGGLVAAAVAVIGIGAWLAGRNQTPVPQHSGGGGLITDADPSTGTDSTSARFLAARDALFRKDYPKAREMFSALADNGGTRQPTAAWARFNAGLAALFAGETDAARSAFQALASVQPWSDSAEDGALAGFFRDAGGWLGAEDPVPPGRVADCPGDSVRAICLLAAGLKNWQSGRFPDALPFLKAFADSTPPRSAQWLDAYKDFAGPWLADARILASLPAVPDNAETLTLDEARSRLQAARDTGAGVITAQGTAEAARVVDAFSRTVVRLEDAAATRDSEMRQKAIRQEITSVREANAEAAALAGTRQFDAAAAKLRALTPSSPEVQDYLRTQIRLWENADTFLDLLCRDLAQPVEALVERTDATTAVRGKVSAGTGHDLKIRPEKGTDVTLPATRITPSTLVSLAESVLERTADSDEYYRRRELLVAFALRSGLTTYAEWAARELCRESRTFRATWTRLRLLDSEIAP